MTTDLRPFSEWITDHARGTVDDEMTMAIAEVTEAVAHHDKPGTVVLKLKIEPAGNGGRTVATSCVVEAKPPQPGAEQSIFYVGEGGSLHRDDPYQTRLDVGDVRRVDTHTGEVRLPNTTGDTEA